MFVFVTGNICSPSALLWEEGRDQSIVSRRGELSLWAPLSDVVVWEEVSEKTGKLVLSCTAMTVGPMFAVLFLVPVRWIAEKQMH